MSNQYYRKHYLTIIRQVFVVVGIFVCRSGIAQTGILTNDTIVCPNSLVALKAAPALGYFWTPAIQFIDPGQQNQTLKAETSGTYFLERKVLAANLVPNGDFENGNSGFFTNYTLCNSPNCLSLLSDNGYAIGKDASALHNSFIGKDHSGNGNFMVVNGARPGLVLWQTTITVKPNTLYAFGTWISSLNNLNTAQFRLSINGIQLDPTFNAPATPEKWLQFFVSWNSGADREAIIEIVNILPVASGNDFGLDDIFFGELNLEKDSVQVTVKPNNQLFATDTIGLCNEPVLLDAGAGYDHYNWNSGATTQQISVNTTGEYSVAASLDNGCTVFDTVFVKNSLTMTTRPLVGCGEELVLLNNGVVESVRGKVIEFFSDSVRSYQLNASVKISTRHSTQGKFNSAAEYRDFIDKLVENPPTNGFGDTYLPVYRIVSNNIIFNGPKNDIAYKYTVRFFAREAGVYQFRTSFDFGRGGAIFLDGNIAAFNNQDMWWNGNWSAPGQSLQWSTTLGIGMHEILIYGLEDCCDGGGNAEYKAPGDTEFTPFSTLAYVKDVGTYYVTLHDPVTGCSSKSSIKVTRSPKPSITVHAPAPVCTPETIDLTLPEVTAGSDAPLNFNYFTDPETTVRLLDPTAITDSGLYYIIGQAQNNCYSDTKSVLVKIYSPPATSFESSQKTGCIRQSVAFRNTTPINGDYLLHWTFGTGNPADTSNELNPYFTFNEPGSYPVTLTVYAPGGCFTSHTDTIKIFSTPAMIISGPARSCVNGQVQFTGISNEPQLSNLTWIFGNGSRSDQLQPEIQTYPIAGDYTIQLIGGNGVCSDTALFQLKVDPGPVIDLAGPLASICLGSSVQLFANGGNNYLWTPSAGLDNPGKADPTASPIVDTKYFVQVTTPNNCVGFDSVQVIVNQPINISVPDNASVCAGDLLQLQANGAVHYQWSPVESLSNPNLPDPIARPLVTTSYKVIGFGRDNCFSDTANIFVLVNPRPFVQAGNDTTIVAGTAIQLSIQASSDVVAYRWTPAAGLSCTACSQPYANPVTGTTYTIAVQNDAGCEATDQIEIRLNCSANNVFIPNAFSPNNDGQNDIFYPMGKGIRMVNYLRIYNRWGKLVFERKNFPINNRDAGWDGKVNGMPQANQAFVYATQLVCENGQFIELKGKLTLLQ